LGYYSRARNLQQGVREVVSRYGGQMPDTLQAVRDLPGIGAYTAGAILSIAHNKPEPAVDGNVLRVISRLYRIEESVDQARTKNNIETLVRQMMEQTDRFGDFTQALMELGALICVPRSPRCDICPWQTGCIAARDQVQAALPKKKINEAPQAVQVYTGILIAEGRLLAEKRPASGLLAGMWQFPAVEILATEDAGGEWQAALQERFSQLGQPIQVQAEWRRLKHVFSHREWHLRAFHCSAVSLADAASPETRWLTKLEITAMNWAGPYRKLAAAVQDELL
jgi:A/G-specific adenine glycosylase